MKDSQISNEIKALVEDLPFDLLEEVKDFIEFIKKKRVVGEKKKPNFSWAGSLSDLKDKYTSVELQNKIVDLRLGN